MTRYIGLYWTHPVPWAGFTALPQDPGAAAKVSRTVAYQRERIRRWVKNEGGTLVHEEVFLELAPDRGSEQIGPTVDRLLARCRTETARLVLVEFWSANGWRRHGPLAQRLEEHPELCVLLDPEPLATDTGTFDPVEHFRAWREVEATHAGSKAERRAALAQAIAARRPAHPSFAELSQALNDEGLTSPTGRSWTAENLRKFLKTA